MSKYLTRQADIIPAEALGVPVTIVGCGAIGSVTALYLAKMGMYNMSLWDGDVVSEENMNGQCYPVNSIGKNKAEVLSKMCEEFGGIRPRANYRNFGEEEHDRLRSPIVIASVDSMDVRKDLFLKCTSSVDWFIDPRMGAEVAQLHVVSMKSDAESWLEHWYPSDKASPEPCTAKVTGYCALGLATQVVKAVKDIITGNPPVKKFLADFGANDIIIHKR